MLTFEPIVRVNVTTNSQAAESYKFDVGLILGPSTAINTAERIKTFNGTSAMLAAGFTEEMPEYLAAVKYFAQTPAPEKVMIGRIDASTETPETPVQALTACLAKSSDFYGVYCTDATSSQIQALAEQAKTVGGIIVFFSNNDTASAASGEAGIFSTLKTADHDRVIGIWSTDAHAGAALLGLCCGMANKHRSEAWALCYKELNGIAPSDVTSVELTALKAVNANVFVTRGTSMKLLENGAMASGMRFDEVLAIDRIASDLQAACINIITKTSTKLPQRDSTTTLFFNACARVCRNHLDMGVLSPGIWRGETFKNLEQGATLADGYTLMADSFDSQSDSDRRAKKAMPIYAAVHLAGSVESALIEVAVQL